MEKIKVFAIEHDGPTSYNLKGAELVRDIPTSVCTYLEDYQIALVEAGYRMDGNGALVAVKDDAYGVVFFHRDGFSGRITRHNGLAKLNAYLLANFGMSAKGRIGDLK